MTALFIHATWARLPDAMLQGGVDFLLVPDAWGSPRLVVRADAGEIAQRLGHDPWGAVIEDTSPGFQPFGFLGGPRDPDAGLVRIAGRDFDGETDRRLARAPRLFEAGRTNLYALPADPSRILDDPEPYSHGAEDYTDPLTAPDHLMGGAARHRGFIHDRCRRTAGAATMSLFRPLALDLPGPRFEVVRAWAEAAIRRPWALPPALHLQSNGLAQFGGGWTDTRNE